MTPVFFLLAVLADASADDRDLAIAIRNGDHAAFRVFFDRHHGALSAYLMRRGVSAEEAADLLQHAFVTIWEKRDTLDPELSLRGYLFRIGLSKAYNRFRDTARLTPLEPHHAEEQARTPDEDMHWDEMRMRIHAAIASLPEKRRLVFELRYLQELSIQETADALELSPKTVENHMTMALRDLRERLREL